MKNIISTIILASHVIACYAQNQDGRTSTEDAPCENCEATLEYGRAKLNWIDTLADFQEEGPKIV